MNTRVLNSSIIALALAAGSTAVVAQSPPPEVGSAAPVAFTSTYAWSHQPTVGVSQTLDSGVKVVEGEAWQFVNIEASDPRFAGTMTMTDTAVTYPGGVGIAIGAHRIATDEGAWQDSPWSSFGLATEPPGSTTWHTFIGEGAYEGYWAVVKRTWRPDGATGEVDIELDGYIVEGDPLAAPEPWSAERQADPRSGSARALRDDQLAAVDVHVGARDVGRLVATPGTR